jgi:hypothetical protein
MSRIEGQLTLLTAAALHYQVAFLFEVRDNIGRHNNYLIIKPNKSNLLNQQKQSFYKSEGKSITMVSIQHQITKKYTL